MSPAKKKSSTQAKSKLPQQVSGWFSGVIGTLILCIMLAGIFIACAYAAWQKIGSRVLASPEYFVGPEQFEITQPPPWLHRSDLRVELYNDLSRRGPIRIMDEDLIERVHAALLQQPWVAKILRVQKQYPAKIKVELVYRRPVCMVEISGELIPVDVEGTLLPNLDFSPVEKAKYPRLIGVDRGPMRGVGARWGDSRVAGGAEIANELLPLWEKLNLQSIVPHLPPEAASAGASPPRAPRRLGDYYFSITTRGGMRIFWGRSPASNSLGESTPEQKIKKLKQFFDEHGSLDYPQGPRELDLRQP